MALIWGRHPITEALRAQRPIEQLSVAEGIRPTGLVADILRMAADRGVRIRYIDRRALDRMSEGANHQGLVAEVPEYHYRTLDDLIERGKKASGQPLILALDTLADPQNFGTLLRTADACGVTGVLIPLHRAVGVTASVEKSSAGAVEHLEIARVTNLARGLNDLKSQKYWVVGLDASGQTLYDSFPVDVPLVLVVGAEERGLGRVVASACDLLVRVPMLGHVESLNAGVAGSIVLYDILRRRTLPA